VNPNPQSISVIADQRRNELMHDAAQQRLARVAMAASPGAPALKGLARFAGRRNPSQGVVSRPWTGRLRHARRSHGATTTTTA
jgi:hypothetical protein